MQRNFAPPVLPTATTENLVVQQKSALMSRKEAAKYLGVSEQTLAIWKCTGRYGLTCIKIGRLAKYRKSDLDEFIQRQAQKSGHSSNV